eukprot:4143980-Pyramimonas_sp.AAC.1
MFQSAVTSRGSASARESPQRHQHVVVPTLRAEAWLKVGGNQDQVAAFSVDRRRREPAAGVQSPSSARRLPSTLEARRCY